MVRAVDTRIPWLVWGMLGVSNLLFPSGGWVMECTGAWHVLQCMLMVFPDQAGSLQGSRCGSSDILTANDPGTGSGWQQSKQNWALPAVVGYWARMQCSDPCCVQGARLHPYYNCLGARKGTRTGTGTNASRHPRQFAGSKRPSATASARTPAAVARTGEQ